VSFNKLLEKYDVKITSLSSHFTDTKNKNMAEFHRSSLALTVLHSLQLQMVRVAKAALLEVNKFCIGKHRGNITEFRTISVTASEDV